jgi:ubiquinone/menaquinone biosynthesis C-methylase UbiE
MPIAESTSRRLVLKSGSTTLTLDKGAGKASMQRKLLMWQLKPAEAALSDISDVSIDAAVDRASGVEVYHIMLVHCTGEGWAFPAPDKKGAELDAAAIRDFLARPA